jgi:hypothetical protein
MAINPMQLEHEEAKRFDLVFEAWLKETDDPRCRE